MKNRMLAVGLILCSLNSLGQVDELENFRKEITLFVNYDNGKIDSLPRSVETSKRLTDNYETAFLNFIKHKDSKNLDSLKKYSIDNKTSNIIGNHSYFFGTLRKNPFVKSLENNVYYQVTIYPLYDYKLPNFVSFYIQPFTIDTSEYVIYYCKLNGKGTYYIKEPRTNNILFKSEGLTSNAPVRKFSKIDDKHLLIIEDMGDNGERALVVHTDLNKWKPVKGFYGKAFFDNSSDYAKKTEAQMRLYFKFAESKTVISLYGEQFLKKY